MIQCIMNEDNVTIYTVKVVPPKYSPLCQPCEVYFYSLQNCIYLLQLKREITSKENAITVHSLIHNQLSAPVFKHMLQYAWYASKLIHERNYVFTNVRKTCECNNYRFLKRAWCRKFLFCISMIISIHEYSRKYFRQLLTVSIC